MSKLLITSQVYENYGDATAPHWKPKGGRDYVVKNLPWVTAEDFENAITIVNEVTPKIEQNNEYYRESVIGWEIVNDNYLTEFELSQQKYDGKITYGPTELVR